ncbi:MAG: UDP-N-acetylglucosamine 2-epimerase (non-hydrolyzing) [candidate division WOR-3 bacterium]
MFLSFGTRPEAIKLAPVIRQLKRHPESFRVFVAVTAQHRSMLDQVLSVFDIKPDFDLDIMRAGQSPGDVTRRTLTGIERLIVRVKPDVMLVQGDTTSAFASALAAFYHRVPVGHIEAGLRTADKYAPYPEEMNRRLISNLSDIHFAPTQQARKNLLGEGVPARSIHVTGNTVIDALHLALKRRDDGLARASSEVAGPHVSGSTGFQTYRGSRHTGARFRSTITHDPESRILLVTAHRRESFGPGFERICQALAAIVRRNPDVELVYPVHLNPNVRRPVMSLLGNLGRVHLVEPLEYLPFVRLMERSYLILTDSGGIQEEAPALGKPVLVLRDKTERPEAIKAGTAILVGTDPARIVAETERLLNSPAAYYRMARAKNPFGDGRAAQRIVHVLRRLQALGIQP